jgi:hypothetical protein
MIEAHAMGQEPTQQLVNPPERRTIWIDYRDQNIVDAAIASVARECQKTNIPRTVALEYMSIDFLNSGGRIPRQLVPLARRLRCAFWLRPHPGQAEMIDGAFKEIGRTVWPVSTPRDRLIYLCMNRISWSGVFTDDPAGQ